VKHFPILSLVLMGTMVIGACGAQGAEATPTVNALDLQGTVAAAAFTVIAETQAAIPTATPVPPTPTFTDTPLPTLTSPPLPASQMTVTPVPAGNTGGGDPCLVRAMPTPRQGDSVRMRIDNSTRVTVSVTVYLNQIQPGGECGYRSYTLAPSENVVINNLVTGCYTLWAWNPDPDEYFIVTNGTNCLYTSDTSQFDISTDSITLKR
jgi:hypothetical protein